MQSLLRTRLSTIARVDVINRYYHLSPPLWKNKKSSIQELIKNINSEEKEKSLKSLVKDVQNKSQQQQRQKKVKKNEKRTEKPKANQAKMNYFDNTTSLKGQNFLFPKGKEANNNIKEKRGEFPEETKDAPFVNADTEEVVTNTASSEDQESLKVGKQNLLDRIENDDSNREVSRLMSAMIDRIDQQADDVEENFQKLIKSFSSGKSDNRTRPNKRDYNNKKSRSGQRRPPIKTYFDSPSTLFKELSLKEVEHELSSTNYFQSKWNEELNELLPQEQPKNAFEVKMLDIDREWQFPIDNEQDMGIEDSTGFDEHVFLDHLLEEFPEEGPVAKFMELVVTGLQQNPHLSVEEKTNQVLWFKDYFERFSEDDLKVANLEF